MADVVLVDDSPTIRKVVELSFAEESSTLHTFANGETALEYLQSGSVDVLLADVSLPDIDGYELCRRFKANPRTSHVPVVMLAGTFEPFDIRRAESVGYHSYLTKPFATSQLLALVRELIQAGVRPGTDDSQDGSGRARDPIPGQTAKKETGTVNKPLFSLTPQQCRPTPSFVNVADFQDFEEAVLTEPAGEPTTASEQPTASTAVPSINLSPEKIDLLVSRVMERLPGEIRRILSDALKDL